MQNRKGGRSPAPFQGRAPGGNTREFFHDNGGGAERQFIAISQGAPLPTAKPCPQIRRATAENERDVDATRNRQPGATTTTDRRNLDCFIRSNSTRMPGRKFFFRNFELKLAAAPSHDPVVGEAKSSAAEADFEQRRRFFIAHQKIGYAGGMAIESAA